MSMTIEAFGIDRLSTRERLDLIEKIWGSLPEQVRAEEVPEWHLAELTKRREQIDAVPAARKPWRELLDGLGGHS